MMFRWLTNLIIQWRRKRQFKKRMEELRKKDPFIYK